MGKNISREEKIIITKDSRGIPEVIRIKEGKLIPF